ncbi:MAG: DUF4102 domain-containing protein, partial [SAR324 cluster bacterium]|nr:DUF4102 domain-containing protein [SAR324 cluster bacterium]
MAKNLTAKWVENVRPPLTGQAEYFDSKVAGLALRVGCGGKKSWTVYYRLKGRPARKRVTLDDPWPDLGVADAREKAQEIMDTVAEGKTV